METTVEVERLADKPLAKNTGSLAWQSRSWKPDQAFTANFADDADTNKASKITI